MSRLKNQRGQSSVEYILIISLAVAVVLGAVYQLNSAFKVFSNNYFGEYLSCLLETGELPTLGGETSEGICASEFKPFSLAEGKPLVGDPIGSEGSGEKNKGDIDDPSSAKSTGSGVANAESASNSPGLGASMRGSRTRVRRNGGGRGSGEDDKENNGTTSSPSAFANGYDSNKMIRTPVRYPEGYRGKRRFQDEKEDKRTKISKAQSDSETKEEGQKIFKVRARVPAAIDKDEGIDFSVGNLLRYLIIFIIIIAILVFIGGQALQVSKNS